MLETQRSGSQNSAFTNNLDTIANKNSRLCLNCNKYQEITNYDCEDHFFCDNCLKIIDTNINKKLKCEKCFLIISEFEAARNNETNNTDETAETQSKTNNFHQNSKNLNFFRPICEICKGSSDLAFMCNHNLCHSCISNTVLKLYKDFAQIILQNNISRLKPNFTIKCPIFDCKEFIKIPVNLMSSRIRNYLLVDETQIILNFAPYLDGIKTNFSLCKCGQIIGRTGAIKSNCKC